MAVACDSSARKLCAHTNDARKSIAAAYALQSHLERIALHTYLETSLRKVRLLRLSCRVAASLAAGLSASFS